MATLTVTISFIQKAHPPLSFALIVSPTKIVASFTKMLTNLLIGRTTPWTSIAKLVTISNGD
jgi:hypothetical protein